LAKRAREITPADRDRFERTLAEMFEKLGMDLDTPGTQETPRRFLQALIDATNGYDGDPKLVTVFPTECHGDASCELAQIVEGPIPFFALCEHHALPFFGTAYVGYVAHDQIIGISKLTRLVRVLTQRFGVQERMTHQIAKTLEELLNAHGVAVYMEADHLCTQMRGVREDAATTRTTGYRGVYERDRSLRSEFFTLAGIGPGNQGRR
jgi:GTP cyclohydrolase I